MTSPTTSIIFIFSLLLLPSFSSAQEKLEQWPIEIAVPESARNVARDFDDTFLTNSVSFDWSGADTKELHSFYDKFFTSLGWENPFSGSANADKNWSSYGMTFGEENNPIAKYASQWKAQSVPTVGNVVLQLNAYENGSYQGTVTIQLAPDIDFSPLFRLNNLLGQDPKNWFLLHRAINGNPLDLSTISLPANYRDETNPLVSEYYSIVDELIAASSEWKKQYISK